jgi:IS30 family transposase
MSAEDRETLSLGLAHGHSLRTMATVLGRAPSALSRERARTAVRAVSCLDGAHPGVGSGPSADARPRKLLDPWLWQ